MNNNRKKYEKIVEKENKEKGIFKESLRDILFINIIYMRYRRKKCFRFNSYMFTLYYYIYNFFKASHI